jgi:hypothetical protein
VALCSLNWFDIYAYFFARRAGAARILEHMRVGYESASVFLRLTPGMPMPQFTNVRAVGTVAQRGHERRAALAGHLALAATERLVMVSLGGMELRPPVEQWPALPGLRLVVPAAWRSRHPQTVDLEDLGWPFMDVLSSCDALICKLGYGSCVEAACAGIPILYLGRPSWPEIPYLVEWLRANARCADLTQEEWVAGDLVDKLSALWTLGRVLPVPATGAHEAAKALAPYLS